MEVVRGGGRGEVQRSLRLEALGEAGVVGEQAQRLGVAEDRHPRPGRQRLTGQQQPGVDQLGDGVHADDPGLAQQRGDGVVRQPGRAHGVPLRHSAVPGALHHDQRLGGGGPPCEPVELPRVADGFEVHQRDVGLRVVVPVLQHVVAGHVGAVAGRDEGGDAGDPGDAAVAPVQAGEQRDTDGPGLGEQADPPGAGHLGGEGGVEADPVGGVDHAERVGTDHAHAEPAGATHESALPLEPLGAELGVPGGEHHHPLHPVRPALVDHLGHPVGGHGHHGEVDGSVDLGQRAARGNTVDVGEVRGEGGVDGVQRAGEAAVAQVLQHAAADAARSAAHSDHGHRPGREQPAHGARLGTLFTGLLDGERAVGGFEVEVEADHSLLEAALLGVPGVREHLDHLGVARQHLGGEAAYASFPGHSGDVLEQRGGDPAALVRVLDQEGDLGLVGGRGGGHAVGVHPVVADGGDELAAHGGGEADPVHVVVMGEAVDVLGGQARVRREEAQVLRLVGDLLVEADQAFRVVLGDGPDVGDAAVAEHHVGFPVCGVLVTVRRALHTASLRLAAPIGARGEARDARGR